MLDAIADPSHPSHADAKQWADDYDPDVIDEPEIKDALGRMTPRAKARPARKSGLAPPNDRTAESPFTPFLDPALEKDVVDLDRLTTIGPGI